MTRLGEGGPGKVPGTSSGPDEGSEQGENPLRETVMEWVREAMAAERTERATPTGEGPSPSGDESSVGNSGAGMLIGTFSQCSLG